jgi:hypothetical protein
MPGGTSSVVVVSARLAVLMNEPCLADAPSYHQSLQCIAYPCRVLLPCLSTGLLLSFTG